MRWGIEYVERAATLSIFIAYLCICPVIAGAKRRSNSARSCKLRQSWIASSLTLLAIDLSRNSE